jgi:hypothetical protein
VRTGTDDFRASPRSELGALARRRTRSPRGAIAERLAVPSPVAMGGGGAPGAKPAPGVVGLVNRRTGERPGDSPDLTTPETSGDGSVSQGQPGSLAYKNQEADSASSLGSLINEVADFVVPERVPEKIPHKATGACPRNDASSRYFPLRASSTPRRERGSRPARGGGSRRNRARARVSVTSTLHRPTSRLRG